MSSAAFDRSHVAGCSMAGYRLLESRDLSQAAGSHPVGDLGENREVVGDDEQGEVPLFAKLCQEVQDLGLYHDVERRRWFVGDQKRRVACQGSSSTQ